MTTAYLLERAWVGGAVETDVLVEIADGRATTLDTTGRASAEWGQPWLSSYLSWKSRAKRGG